jgi:hypothetical protein
MRKLVLSLAFMIFAGVAMSQTSNDYVEVERAALKTEKKAIVAEAMQLTDEESKAFWPLYNEYSEKKYVINTKVYDLILKFANEYETLSDEAAIELWKENMKVKNEKARLESTYFKKFQKILSGKKVLRYFQTESKLAAIVNYQLASEIPLAE